MTLTHSLAVFAAVVALAAAPPPAAAEAALSREKLLLAGEQALERGDALQAALLFQQAGFVKHAADAEIGLTRAYMQAGEYRRALAFAAHTAGAHPDSAAGGALYARLLDLGDLSHVAARVLPPSATASSTPRFGPASPDSATLPGDARAAASGVLVGDGRTAFAPAAALRGAERLWVRNGLGAVSAATLLRTFDELDLAVLLLEQPPAPAVAELVSGNLYPGATAFAVEYSNADAAPAWPALRSGFLGKPLAGSKAWRLGIDVPPGPHGGPVFDSAGRLCGIAVSGERLLPASLLRPQIMAGSRQETAGGAKLTAEEIYERALAVTLQIIVLPR